MTWMESKCSSTKLDKLLNELAEILEKKYKSIEIKRNGKTRRCFEIKETLFIIPGYMYGGKDNMFHNLVIGYAQSKDELEKFFEEEGVPFFPEDYETKEKMFDAIIREIEEASQ